MNPNWGRPEQIDHALHISGCKGCPFAFKGGCPICSETHTYCGCLTNKREVAHTDCPTIPSFGRLASCPLPVTVWPVEDANRNNEPAIFAQEIEAVWDHGRIPPPVR